MLKISCLFLQPPLHPSLPRDYTQVVMNYLEGKKSGEEKDMEWAKYFDVIIVGGNKPSFLEDERYVTHRTERILY
jgi:5' nucleotidase family